MTLLFIDLETTGLDPLLDQMLEIGLVLADDEFHEIDHLSVVVHAGLSCLNDMDPIVQEMHRSTGLWDEVLASNIGEDGAQAIVKAWLPATDGVIMPGGSGFDHFDRGFLKAHGWTDLLSRLHYGSVDVSPTRRLITMVDPEFEWTFRGDGYGPPHRALADAADALHQAAVYAEFLRFGKQFVQAAGQALGPLPERYQIGDPDAAYSLAPCEHSWVRTGVGDGETCTRCGKPRLSP